MRSCVLACVALGAFAACGGKAVGLHDDAGTDASTVDATARDAGEARDADSATIDSAASDSTTIDSAAPDSTAPQPMDSGGSSPGDAQPMDTGTYPDGPPYEYVDGGFTRNPGQDASVVVPEGGSPLAVFTGYFENYMFPSGSDALYMDLALGADGMTVTGVAVLGTGTPPPPPTQPNVGYPPGWMGSPTVVEGYAYTALSGTLASQRLRFGIDFAEPWAEWCQIQTVYPIGNGMPGYACCPGTECGFQMGPGTGFGACQVPLCDGGAGPFPNVPIDCEQGSLCGAFNGGNVCTCAANGCTHPLIAAIQFDMQLTPMHLDGSAADLPNIQGNVNVHLVQQ